MAPKHDPMHLYMQEISQFPLLTREEEIELARQAAEGRTEARNRLIRCNLRLVVKIAHDFKGLGLPLIDLISEGNVGLIRAAERFDPAKGAKFSSYAAWWIKQAMRRALANQSRTVRVPAQSSAKLNKIKQARVDLFRQLGRDPTDSEIARVLDLSERTVAGLRRYDVRSFSLQEPIQDGEDGELGDIIPDQATTTPDRILGQAETVQRMLVLLETLDEREREVLTMRFGLDGRPPRTLEEVSRKVGKTRERVRQIQNRALAKLKALLDEEVPAQ